MKNEPSKRISALNAILLTAVSLLSVAAIAIPDARAASSLLPSDQCDAEAGSEHDLQRNLAFRPVATDDIRIGIALSACREAYNQGSGPRQTFELARVLHAAGQRGQAMAMLEEAAAGNHAIAMVNYAVMLGERGDHAAEFALYQKAAATGNILAAYNLGVAYRDGTGTPANGALAAQWFERASVARDNLGAFNLAVMLDEGKQLPEDNRKGRAVLPACCRTRQCRCHDQSRHHAGNRRRHACRRRCRQSNVHPGCRKRRCLRSSQDRAGTGRHRDCRARRTGKPFAAKV